MRERRAKPKVLAMIMAGGKGERLMPLTELRSKPAVPFAGNYRIIDFVLSNFLNSGILAMYVLVQYRSQSLIEHLRRGWRIGGRIKQNFITVVPPQMKARGGWYEGNADAVYQNLNLILDFEPDVVAVFGADHINDIPGLRPYEERGYWRDVGTLDAYWQAHMDILDESPRLNLRNDHWPILTDNSDGPAASLVRSQLDAVMVGQGSQVIDAAIRRSVIGRNVIIKPGAQIEESVILDGAVIGSKVRLRRVIADRFNVIPGGTEIGYNTTADRARYRCARSGLVVLPRGRSVGEHAVEGLD